MRSRPESEKWKSVPGYEGLYEVSDHGRVRSLTRTTVHRDGIQRKFSGKLLRPNFVGKGYVAADLYRHGKRKRFYVHRLVMLAFAGACPAGMECCHKDGDKTNNHLKNIRYDTPQANNADKKHHGTHIDGSHHYNTEFTEIDVEEIRNEYATGYVSCKQLADSYGVIPQTTHCIVTRTTWKHVGGADCSVALQARHNKGGAKLTPHQVREMRSWKEEHDWTAAALAARYGVSVRTVHSIVSYRSWKDV